MHKSLQIWGWFLPKKIDLPTQGGGVEMGILGGPGNVMNCPENIKFVFTHPTRGGGGVKISKVR